MLPTKEKKMKVILLERIERLGKMGDIVDVKTGYARNYLLPQKKALRSTKENMAYFEAKKQELALRNADMLTAAEALAETMKEVSLVIVRQASEAGQLYGSVSGRDIHEELKAAGYDVARKNIDLNQPIKNIGIYQIRLVLHPDVEQTIQVNIARSQEEAKKALKAAAKKEEKAQAEAVKASETEEQPAPVETEQVENA
jgi:large subunit ribosomal protein L9